jgi:hypothetical protein
MYLNARHEKKLQPWPWLISATALGFNHLQNWRLVQHPGQRRHPCPVSSGQRRLIERNPEVRSDEFDLLIDRTAMAQENAKTRLTCSTPESLSKNFGC